MSPLSRRDFVKAGAVLTLAPIADELAIAQPQPQLGNLTAPGDGHRVPSPEWMTDLIIYEIATRGFTSPNGPESGTFNSLREKLAYLQELGVTGIWLTGYSLCDPRHFYNIWTQYAVIEPDKFDPALGTPQDFKTLIDEAHRRGIRVFLDVITHGLMNASPVIREHPGWFRGGSWGMTDFDWCGGHTDLDNWWVKIYSDFVTVYGADGYRLDVDIYRPDLWERIRQNAAAAGHPIVIWEEVNSVIPLVTDFSQRENVIATHADGKLNEILVNDLPGFYDRKFGRAGDYEVQIRYEDGTRATGTTRGAGPLGVLRMSLSADRVGRRFGDAKPDGLPDVKLTLDKVSRQPIDDIIVRSDMGEEWRLRPGREVRALFVDVPESFGPLIAGPTVDLYIATLAWGSSIQLSCHDNGWTGFPLDKIPYVAQGSRALFGYSFLFSPMIPIFFSGEEFNATFHPLPDLSPYLYGGKDAGKGRWLYGSAPDWSELQQAPHQDMFLDVKKIMAIRKEHSSVLAMQPGGKEPNLSAIRCQADIAVPVPYLRWDQDAAIVIAANRSRDADAILTLEISLAGTPIDGREHYSVTDLWSNTGIRKCTLADLKQFRCTVKRDRTPGGGIAVFKIEPA